MAPAQDARCRLRQRNHWSSAQQRRQPWRLPGPIFPILRLHEARGVRFAFGFHRQAVPVDVSTQPKRDQTGGADFGHVRPNFEPRNPRERGRYRRGVSVAL